MSTQKGPCQGEKVGGKRTSNKQELKEAAAKAWKCISNEESNSLLMSIHCRLDPNNNKCYSRYVGIRFNTFAHLKSE